MTEVVLPMPTAGGCMRPWIWQNGKLHVQPCSIAQLRIGDIAVWFDGRHMIAHRVVELGTDELTTQGDESAAVDAKVDARQLLGRAVRFTKGPISYRLDGPIVAFLTRVGLKPWAKSLKAARWIRDRLRGR